MFTLTHKPMQHPLYTFRSKDRISKEREKKKEKEEKEKEKEKGKRTGKPVPIGPYSHGVHAPENSWLCQGRSPLHFVFFFVCDHGHVWRLLEWNFFPIQFGSALAGFV